MNKHYGLNADNMLAVKLYKLTQKVTQYCPNQQVQLLPCLCAGVVDHYQELLRQLPAAVDRHNLFFDLMDQVNQLPQASVSTTPKEVVVIDKHCKGNSVQLQAGSSRSFLVP